MTDLIASAATSSGSFDATREEVTPVTRMVLDTSVLIADPESVFAFPGAAAVVPLIVVEELERATIVELGLDPDRPDNRLLAAALDQRRHAPTDQMSPEHAAVPLNLGNNPRVQPIALPEGDLGTLEDHLNLDKSFTLHNGDEIPELWKAQSTLNALQLAESDDPEQERLLHDQFLNGNLYLQRMGRSRGEIKAIGAATFKRELRSMAHKAKVARDEMGMNPLYLCVGLLQWPYKPGTFASAPLILVPVDVVVARRTGILTLRLDGTQQTTPNVALIEWLRQEHQLVIPELAEPETDRAGLDIDGIFDATRRTLTDRGLELSIVPQAAIALLDLSAFRMWRDLDLHGERFLQKPLVRHLVESPAEPFADPAIAAQSIAAQNSDQTRQHLDPSTPPPPPPPATARTTTSATSAPTNIPPPPAPSGHAQSESAEPSHPTADAMVVGEEVLEDLEAPVPADATQKTAIVWARQGRTFVLQGPPGTGKSQTITNMIADCVLQGLKVLFVAQKGTALSVVQRRLEAVGLGPFALNLHHEGANNNEIRAQLQRSLDVSVTPDEAATERARRQIRSARYDLDQYPGRLHQKNAAGYSAYGAHDALLLLGDGREVEIPESIVADDPDTIEALRETFHGLPRWTAAARVRPAHPWRLAGVGNGEPFDPAPVTQAIQAICEQTRWAVGLTGPTRELLDAIERPSQLCTIVAALSPDLPSAEVVERILEPGWRDQANRTLEECRAMVQAGQTRLHGFDPAVLDVDLGTVRDAFASARSSGFIGRKKREIAALQALAPFAPAGALDDHDQVGPLIDDLVEAAKTARQIRDTAGRIAGLAQTVPRQPLVPGAIEPILQRIEELAGSAAPLRDDPALALRVLALAPTTPEPFASNVQALSNAWELLIAELCIRDDDLDVWRAGRPLLDATRVVVPEWQAATEHGRLIELQDWCILMRRLEPLRRGGLSATRSDVLDGTLPAHQAEEAFIRGLASASLAERIHAAGFDRFSATGHDELIDSFADAQAEIRREWVSAAKVERVLDDALVSGKTDLSQLIRVFISLAGHGRPGTVLMRSLLEQRACDFVATESELEAQFVRFVTAHHLPLPRRQVNVGDQRGLVGRVDFLFESARLIVEVDGHRFHAQRQVRHEDLQRDLRLNAAGWRVVRLDWWQLIEDPANVARHLRTIIERAEPNSGGAPGTRAS